MVQRTARVVARWDPEGDVWVATSDDIPGLVLAGRSEKELVDKIGYTGLSLLEANVGANHGYDSFIIEYIREDEARPLVAA